MKNVLIILVTIILLSVTNGGIIAAKETGDEKSNAKKMTIKWKFETGGEIYSKPAVFENTIYVGSRDKKFYAVDAETGKEKWSYKTKAPIHSTAAISDGIICFESGNVLYGLNLKGELIWEFDMFPYRRTHKIDFWDFHHSSPVVSEGVAYIGTEYGYIYGIDIKSGKDVFFCKTGNENIIRTTPAIKNGKIYLGDWEGIFYCFDLETKEKVWEFDAKLDVEYPWKPTIQTDPVIVGDLVYFSGRISRIYALSLETGQNYFMYPSPTNEWIVGGASYSDGLLYFGSSNQHFVQAINAKNSRRAWKADVDCRVWGTSLVYGDHLYIGSLSFYKIDKKTGEIVDQLNFEKVHPDKTYGKHKDVTANIHSSAAAANGIIYFGSDDGYLYAVSEK